MKEYLVVTRGKRTHISRFNNIEMMRTFVYSLIHREIKYTVFECREIAISIDTKEELK